MNTVIIATFYVVAFFLELGIGFSLIRVFPESIQDISYFGLLYGLLGLSAVIPGIAVLLFRMNYTIFAAAEPDRPGSGS